MGVTLVRHQVNCDVETYWRCFFDLEYNRRLHLEALHYGAFDQTAFDETEATITRRLELKTPSFVPGPITKLLGGQTWIENGVFDKKTKRFRVDYETGTLKGRLTLGATYWVEPRDDRSVDRLGEVQIEMDSAILRSLVEMSVKVAIGSQAKFTNSFLKEKGW